MRKEETKKLNELEITLAKAYCPSNEDILDYIGREKERIKADAKFLYERR